MAASADSLCYAGVVKRCKPSSTIRIVTLNAICPERIVIGNVRICGIQVVLVAGRTGSRNARVIEVG